MRRAAVTALLLLAAVSCGDDDDAETVGADRPDATSSPATSAPATTVPVTTAAPAATATTAAPAASTTSGAPSGDAFEFTSADGSYTIIYPAEPSERTQQQQLPDGSTLPVTLTILGSPDEAFISSVVEYPPEVTADLQGAVDGAIANSGATLIAEQDIELGGRLGRQFVADVGGEGTLIARLYVDGNRLWQVLYTGAGEISPDDPAPAAFFDSFRFTEGG
jgi:hypothetical protein